MEGLQKETHPQCGLCLRTPDQIDYRAWKREDQSNDEFVRTEEGTYDPETDLFLCDACYIQAGCPVNPDGSRWIATYSNVAVVIIKNFK